MTTVREYRTPLAIAGGTLVLVILLWAILISPQKSKLSSLQSQESQLQSQQSSLHAKLLSLQSEQQQLSSRCTDLEKIATQIPSVQSPTDIDAEESSFESQFNGLTASTGVTLSQFSGFAPASATGSTATPAAGATKGTVVAVPTTLAVTGNYGQMRSFINGLDSFPRLFVIQNFVLSFGATSASSGTGSSATSSVGSTSSAASPTSSANPLWIGGAQTSPAATPYNLAITGSIYYTTTPSAIDACTKATAK
jgi:Tfp pilus assembly protein PilO